MNIYFTGDVNSIETVSCVWYVGPYALSNNVFAVQHVWYITTYRIWWPRELTVQKVSKP